MSRFSVDTPSGGRPPPGDDTAFSGRPTGLLTAHDGMGMTAMPRCLPSLAVH